MGFLKIAIISGTPAFPSSEGNRVRILTLLQSLRADGHDVWFLYLPTWSLKDVDAAAHADVLGEGRFIELKGEVTHGVAPPWFRIKRKFLKLMKGDGAHYNHLDEYFHAEWSDQIEKLHQEHNFDAAVVEYAFHSKALLCFPGDVLKVLDTHDCFTNRHRLFAPSKDPLGYWVSFPSAVEERAFRRADVVLGIQEEEAAAFVRRLEGAHARVEVVSHVIGIEGRVGDYRAEDFLFLGSGNDANAESIGWFIAEVFPLILRERPKARLVVAGGACRHVPDAPNIVKLGRVERVVEAFRQAPLSINPMRVGTGINIKLLDAMAVGVATVTTRTGARGLPLAYQGGVRIVEDDDVEGFAAELLSFCASEVKRREVGEAAYEAALAWNQRQLSSLRDVMASASRARADVDG